MDKVYWSSKSNPDSWDSDGQVFNVVLIPRRWYDLKHWILAYKFTKVIYITGMARLKPQSLGEE